MKSDFQFGPGATFNFQHDVRHHADGTLTLFDNGASGPGSLAWSRCPVRCDSGSI